MTNEKFNCLLIFANIHNVLKAEKLFKVNTIVHDVVPVPKDIDSDCGMAITINTGNLDTMKSIAENNALNVKGVYTKHGNKYVQLEW